MLNFINNLMNPWYLLSILISIPVVLLSLTIHECSHGYIAYRLGDPTARNLGRLTLNPLKHLDVIGTISMIVFGVGWAKPVPINTRYFKKPKRDMALTALAGPLSNFILSFIAFLLAATLNEILPANSPVTFILLTLLCLFFTLNLFLAVFNLIPIPPFDGSRIAFVLLPDKIYFGVMKYERIIMLAMLLLFCFGVLSGPLNFIANGIANFYFNIFSKIPFFEHIYNLHYYL